MKYLIAFIITLFALPLYAQSISYSPTSFSAWGATKSTEKVDIRYKSFQYIYVNIKDERLDKNGDSVIQFNHALFFAPKISNNGFYVSGGFGYFVKKLANKNGTHLNFVFESGYEKDLGSIKIGVRYSHISNAYRGALNPGIDNISITIR